MGTFAAPEVAAGAYDRAAIAFYGWGCFVETNYPAESYRVDPVLTQLLGPEAMSAPAADGSRDPQGRQRSRTENEMRRLGNELGEGATPQDGGSAAVSRATSASLLPASLSSDDFLGALRTALGARSYRKKRALDGEASDSAGTPPPAPPILTP